MGGGKKAGGSVNLAKRNEERKRGRMFMVEGAPKGVRKKEMPRGAS